MVDYSALRKKFPVKDPNRRRKIAAIKAIAREYEAKRAALGGGAPVMKKGVVFYAVVILGLMILGSLVLSVCGKGGRAHISRAQSLARKSVDSLAVALGRYRYHVGRYPSDEEGLAALSEITPDKKGWNGPYVNHVVKDPWGHDDVYVCNGENETPTLYSKGLDGKAGTTDDVLPDRALYDEPFRDTSWTKGWMPYYLRGYVLAPDEEARKAIREEVKAVLAAEEGPSDGEFMLHDGWEFSRDKKEWRKVRVPHDWAMECPFDANAKDGAGAPPWEGVGWYRRAIELPKDAAGSFVALRFGGVVSNPEVFLNGEKVGGTDAGCRPFEVDISAKLKFGEKNELLVKADASGRASAGHPGAGLCRDVRLAVEDAEDRAIWGSVRITTPEVTPERAKVRVTYRTPVSSNEIVNEFEVERPMLWDVANPKLYETKVCGKTYRYAIRKVEKESEDAFLLNGRRVQLRGVVLDSGPGPLGLAFDMGVTRRQLKLMKDMGVNALCTPHADADQELTELCDEIGILVWGERFDKQKGGGAWCSLADVCDQCGMPKDDFWLYRSLWNDRSETIRLLPHWNWDGREGEKVSVFCCTSGDEAELFVNGESAGKRGKSAERGKLSWEVPYEPGEIKVIAYRNGHPIGEDVRKTASKAVATRLTPEEGEVADGELGFVKAEVEDEEGIVLPLANGEMGFRLEGPGEIVAVCGGSRRGLGPDAGAASVPLYDGRALVVVRRTGASGLPIRLTATAPGLRPATAVIGRK